MIEIKDVSLASSTLSLDSSLQFSLTFDAFAEIDELAWRVTFTPEGDNDQAGISHEQELERVEVGPVPKGINMFELEVSSRLNQGLLRAELIWVFVQAPPPPVSSLGSDLIGVGVLLLCGSYHDQEFITVGYMVRTEFEEGPLRDEWDAAHKEGSTVQAPKAKDHLNKLVRTVGVDKPRVTKVIIKWLANKVKIKKYHVQELTGLCGAGAGTPPRAASGRTLG